ncbi:hypothetical protein BC628DRAFT_1325374 [Trametes gibbosa]|nr:hypothetical protein BC628DRAFT_1325374 [Trametes gibbosa]
MTSLMHRSSPCDVLRDVVQDISDQRDSMSVEMLQMLHESLLIAHALVTEAMNTTCAVDKLPPEILAHIFSFVPGALPPLYASSSARWTYDLLPLTHVCRRWRTIALDTSSLWSTLCETSSTCTATRVFRTRARNAPLAVYVNSLQASTALVDILAHDASNVTELCLFGLLGAPAARLASELLAFPAPRLERATVRCRAGYGGSADVVDPVVELWSGIAPCLKTLELHDLPFLPSNRLQSLTTLTLSWRAVPIKYAFADLVELLGRAPALERVSLQGLPSDLHLRAPSKTATSLPIALPSLRRLEVGNCRGRGCSVPLIRHILSSLAIPPGASVRLYGLMVLKLSPSLDLAASIFTEDTQSRLSVDMTFAQLVLSLVDLQTSSTLRVELGTGGATRASFEQALAAFLCPPIALSVREVVVRSERQWSTWCDPAVLLALLPRLSTVELQDAHLVNEVVDALRPAPAETAPNTTALCPGLETFRVPPLSNCDHMEQFAQDHPKAYVCVGL